MAIKAKLKKRCKIFLVWKYEAQLAVNNSKSKFTLYNYFKFFDFESALDKVNKPQTKYVNDNVKSFPRNCDNQYLLTQKKPLY